MPFCPGGRMFHKSCTKTNWFCSSQSNSTRTPMSGWGKTKTFFLRLSQLEGENLSKLIFHFHIVVCQAGATPYSQLYLLSPAHMNSGGQGNRALLNQTITISSNKVFFKNHVLTGCIFSPLGVYICAPLNWLCKTSWSSVRVCQF